MSGKVRVQGEVQEASIHAVVTRADGRVEDLGIVSYYHKRWYRRLWWNVKKFFKEVLRG